MQTKELCRATKEVANRTDIGATATANEFNRSWRTPMGRSLGRITCSTLFGPLIAAGLFVALAPVPGRADDDRDRYPGHEDSDKGIRGEIAAVQAKIATLLSTLSALQGEVSALQKANTGLQNEVSSLQASNTTLRSQLTTVQANNALKLGPFVSVDPDPEIGVIGPNIIFHGANIHIVSGSGATDDYGDPTGLGNLIIGYDDDPALRGTFPLTSGDRGGSHNLVIGRGNKFTKAAFGGLVTGEDNTISNVESSVLGGHSSIASGFESSVLGGFDNIASGFESSVSGGEGNTANGFGSSVLGGFDNFASGQFASLSGGVGNDASGQYTVVIGGQNVNDSRESSIAPQPPFP